MQGMPMNPLDKHNYEENEITYEEYAVTLTGGTITQGYYQDKLFFLAYEDDKILRIADRETINDFKKLKHWLSQAAFGQL
jgi:hypothetical protein